MALISMETYCTPENNRAELLAQVLENLSKTVDWTRHRMYLIDNSPATIAKEVYADSNMMGVAEYVWNKGENKGTAGAVNMGWWFRKHDENAIKMDDDCIVHAEGWVDQMEAAIERDPSIGIIGLKRKDLEERPDHDAPFFRSTLRMLKHDKGQPWIIVEEVEHVMGTCQMYSAALLEKIGFLFQPDKYGFDDSLSAIRCHVAGMKNVFLPHIEIDHIDKGDTPYQQWKHTQANKDFKTYDNMKAEYLSGRRPIFYAFPNPY